MTHGLLQIVASTEGAKSTEASGDLLGSLGIDWKLFIFQLIGFLVLVLIMSKWIFPVLIQVVEKRRELQEESVRAAIEAEKKAEETQAEVESLMKKARKEASEIVGVAKAEAAEATKEAEQKSKAQAERIVADALENIEKEVSSAKKALHNEMIDLVTEATEKVTSMAVASNVDEKLITESLQKGGK